MVSKEDKIFLTGASGFVGSYIVRALLKEGFKNITCLNRSGTDTPLMKDFSNQVKWVKGDILDLPLMMDVLKNVDIIIHAAAMVTFSTKNKKKLLETAINGTANLVNVAMDCSVKKFIHISSVAALGRRKEQETITEKHIFSHTEFDTTYGLSKFLSEQEVWRAHAEGLPVTILNPALIVGAGDWHRSSVKVFSRVYNQSRAYPIGVNGLVDVRDVAKAVLLAVSSDCDGERFILSAENWSYKDFLYRIAQNLGVKPPKYPLDPFLAALAWRFYGLMGWFKNQSPLITRETVKSMSVRSSYDNTKSREILGISYRNITETLEETCNVFLETYPKGKNVAILKI